jgi:aldehyde dehydrogenase (NAD+)
MSTSRTFDDLNPADGSVWAQVPDGGRNEARAAIDAAHAAFPAWSALPFTQRAHYMIKVAEVFEKRRAQIVEALQAEGGGWFGKGCSRPARPRDLPRRRLDLRADRRDLPSTARCSRRASARRRPVISPELPGAATGRGIAFASPPATPSSPPSEETPYCGGRLR